MAQLFAEQKKVDEAIAAYSKSIELEPDDSDRRQQYIKLGDLLTQQNQTQEAIHAYQKAIELDPNKDKDDHPYLYLGDALSEQGQLERAIATYRQVIQLNPKNASAYNSLGYALQQQGKFEEAIAQYAKAIYFAPDWKGLKENLEEAQRLLALQQNPQLSLLPERLPAPQQDPLVLQKRSVVKVIAKNPSDWGDATGWVVKREGNKAWIVTNRHVVTQYDNKQLEEQIEVEFYSEPPSGQFRKRRPAKVVRMTGANEQLDLAVLEVTDIPKDIQALPISTANIAPDAPIHLIGHPNTSEDWTVSEGKVIQTAELEMRMSAYTVSGSSGSPVLDQQGRVVGLVWGSNTTSGNFNYSMAFPMKVVAERLQSWGILSRS